MSLPEGVERRKAWLIGLDQVTVTGAEKIRQVLDSGDVERITSTTRGLSDLPFWARCFFPVSRFFSQDFGWNLPLISDADPGYPPCRKFFDEKFEKRGFVDADVTAAADLLAGEEPASDEALVKVFAQAIWRYFSPDKPLPDSIIEASQQQIHTPTESFLPWRRWPSGHGTNTVYQYASDSRKDIPGADSVPDKCVTDIANVWF